MSSFKHLTVFIFCIIFRNLMHVSSRYSSTEDRQNTFVLLCQPIILTLFFNSLKE